MSLDKATLEGLAGKLGEAKGPDRLLDAALWVQFGWTDLNARYATQLGPEERVNGMTMSAALERYPSDTGIAVYWGVPRLTDSLDAALALVERVLPKLDFDVQFRAGVADVMWWNGPAQVWRVSEGATPALALLCAMLAALAQAEPVTS